MRKRSIFYVFSLLLCMGFSMLWSESYAQRGAFQSILVTLKAENEPLASVLDRLAETSGVHFFYNHDAIDGTKKVSFDVSNMPLDRAVLQLVDGLGIEVDFQSNKTIVLRPSAQAAGGQEVTAVKVRGRVVDSKTNESLIGATVVLASNPTVGVATDVDGAFSVDVPSNETALNVSFIGYETQAVLLDNYDLTREITISLNPESEEIEEVVVTGMAPRKVEGFTGGYVSIKGEELKKLNPTNVLQSLQFFDPSFRIVENNARGADPNTMPEFQLRGDVQIGTNSSSSMKMMLGDYSNMPNMPLFILDGFETTLQTIVDLDPNRIESVTILKDASAKAIYGSKAANGVVVFETKKPLAGALNISYSSNYAVSAPDLTVYNLMNASEKLEYERRAGLFTQNEEQYNYYYDKLGDIQEGVDTYWLSEPVRIGFETSQTVSADGGDDAFRYNVGLNMNKQIGVMKESDRRTLGMNINLSYRRKKWDVRNQLSLSSTRSHDTPFGSFQEYANLNPYYRKDNLDDSLIEDKWDGQNVTSIYNPLYDWQFSSFIEENSFSLTNNFQVECSILENLQLSATVSFTKTQGENDAFSSPNDSQFRQATMENRGSYSKSWANGFTWNVNADLNYNLVKDKHFFSLGLQYAISENSMNSIDLVANGFPNDNMNDILFATHISNDDNNINIGEESTTRSLGITGWANYMYDNRYALDVTYRGDMSSQFGADSRLAPFWSVGLRWNIYREKFMETLPFSNLVLRANIGTTGSQNYEPYQAVQTYDYSDLLYQYMSSDVFGAQLMALGNSDLGWSTTKERSIALEFALWNNRLTASFNYYNNYTDQLLQAYNIAPSTGFTSIMMNLGAVRNFGYEWTLGFTPINDYARNIQLMVTLNGSHQRNRVENLSNEVKALNQERQNQATGTPLPLYVEGESTNGLWVVPSRGIDPMTGQEVFVKLDGSETFEWDAVDKVNIGETTPVMQGTVGFSFIWKDLSMSMYCMYDFGGWEYNSTLVDKIENANILNNLDKRALEDRWEKPGDIAKYKRISVTDPQTNMSSRFAMKKNEFQFSSVAASYRFDASKYKGLRKAKISSISLSSTFNDLGRISSIKMERGTDYPFARTFNLSLDILFN